MQYACSSIAVLCNVEFHVPAWTEFSLQLTSDSSTLRASIDFRNYQNLEVSPTWAGETSQMLDCPFNTWGQDL